MVLDADSLKIIYRSAVRPRTPKNPNQGIADAGGEDDHQPHSEPLKYSTSSSDGDKQTQPDVLTVFIKSRHDDGPTSSKPLPEFNPEDLVGRTFLPAGDNGERLMAKVTRKVVEVIEKAEGEESKNSTIFLVLAMVKWRKSSPITNLWTIWKLQSMRITRSVMICSSSEHLLAIRDLSSQRTQIGKTASSMFLQNGRLGRRPMNPSHFWQQMIQ